MFRNFIAWKSIAKFLIEDTSKSTSEKFETSKYAKNASLNWPYYKTSYCHDVCYAIYVSEKKISKTYFEMLFLLAQRLTARKRCSNFCFWLDFESYFCVKFSTRKCFCRELFSLRVFLEGFISKILPKLLSNIMPKFLSKIMYKFTSN